IGTHAVSTYAHFRQKMRQVSVQTMAVPGCATPGTKRAARVLIVRQRLDAQRDGDYRSRCHRRAGQRSIAMGSIPVHNETDYPLTDDMMQQIIRDAHEHFGEEVRAIRVQSGIERHALNARTREVRYAFAPQDFGLGPPRPIAPEPRPPETPRSRR